MRPTASSPADPAPAVAPAREPGPRRGEPRPDSTAQADDAAFTLTEMAASLVVAAMLVAGLGEITRQFARTTVRVRATLEETRDARLAQAEALALERADSGEVRVSTGEASARIGDTEARFALSGAAAGERRLTWTLDAGAGADGFTRSMAVDSAARFELGRDGAVRLWERAGEPPLLTVAPRREAPFDCQYDVVIRDCR